MEKILVTGATGFIGKNLVKELVKKKYNLICLVRKTSKTDLLDRLKVKKVFGELEDKESLIKATKNIDMVIHLAAAVGVVDQKVNYETNVEGTKNLVEACRKNGVKKIIFLSTISAILKKKRAYGSTKLEAEKVIINSGLKYVILRPTLVHGKGSKQIEKIKELIKKYPIIPIIGSGKCVMQPVSISDVTKSIIKSLDVKEKDKIYNIGGATKISFSEIIDKIAEEMDIKKPKIHIPTWICLICAFFLEKTMKNPPLTINHIYALNQDSTTDITPIIKELGIKPKCFEDILNET